MAMSRTIGNYIAWIAFAVVLWTGAADSVSGQGLRLEFPDNKATWREIFDEIEKHGGVWFVYTSQDFENTGAVEVPRDEQLSLGGILDFIFRGTDYRYRFDGKHIFITKEKLEPVYGIPHTRIRTSVNSKAAKPRAGERELVRAAVDSTFKEVRGISAGDSPVVNFDNMGRHGIYSDNPSSLFSIINLCVESREGAVAISFDVVTGAKAVDRRSFTHVVPVAGTKDHKICLPGFTVEDPRTAMQRKKHNKGIDMPEDEMLAINGAVINYTTSIPLDSLSIGSDLWLKVSTHRQSRPVIGDDIMLARNIVNEGLITIPATYRTIPHSPGDIVSQKYSFVSPLSEFEMRSETDRNDFVADSRGNSLSVYFRPGSIALEPEYRDNRSALNYISDAVSTLCEAEKAGSSMISHIIVAGFSSPDGKPALNRYLAYMRAKALRDYLAKETGIEPEKIDIYNGGVDWAGLRLRIEQSEFAGKDEVIALISNVTNMTDEEEEALCAKLLLLNGRTYNSLSTSIFPELRAATYLRIYYENIASE